MASFIVTTNIDETFEGTETAVTPDGAGLSLREAIGLANASAGADTITFDGSVFTGGANSVIRLVQGEIEITDEVSIDGAGAVGLIISGDAQGNDITQAGTDLTDVGASLAVDVSGDGLDNDGDGTMDEAGETLLSDNTRIFNFSDADADDSILSNFSITGGHTTAAYYAGGGIFTVADLSINTVSFVGNSTLGNGADGGAIGLNPNNGITISVNNASFIGNSTAGDNADGGAIFSDGTLLVTGSTFDQNSTSGQNSNGGAIGGGETGVAILTNSTVTNNQTTGNSAAGGGVRAYTVVLDDVTVTGNSTQGSSSQGGGIASNNSGGASLTVSNSTISNNSTSGNFSSGGGLFGPSSSVTNSSISGNTVSGAGANGGGISGFNIALTNVTVNNNAITDNGRGGGVEGGNIIAIQTSVVDNSTVNTAGGIRSNDTLTLTNSTVTGNSTGGAFDGGGGGIGFASGAILTSTNSIVLGNETTSGTGVEISGFNLTQNFLGQNIVGENTSDFDAAVSANVTNALVTDVFRDVTAGSGQLSDGGGLIETVALLAGGAADGVGDVSELPMDTADLDGDMDTTEALPIDANGNPRLTGGSLGLGAVQALDANNLVVTTNLDVVDALDGLTSLREAVTLANTEVGADTITFDGAAFTGGADSLIRLTQSLVISDDVTLDASMATGVTITGDVNNDDLTFAGTEITDVDASFGSVAGDAADRLDDNVRVLDITSTGVTTIDGLTITGGRTTGDSGGSMDLSASGAGIRSYGILNLNNTIVAGNSASGLGGTGGGIAVSGATTIDNSTISNNATTGEFARGGGVFGTDLSVLSVTNSTISENSTQGGASRGGGIYSFGVINATNTTVVGNSTAGGGSNGGGIATASALVIDQTTITGNSTAGAGAEGGGLYSGGSFDATNSIVLGNASAQTTVDDSQAPTTFSGLNIIGIGMDTDGSDGVINADPALVFANTQTVLIDNDGDGIPETSSGILGGVLTDNGGLVETVALLQNLLNPAIDVATSVLLTDAIGQSRDSDALNIDNGGTVDAGAFELQAETPSLVVDSNLDIVNPFDNLTTLREAVLLANSNADQSTVTFDASVFTGGATSLIRLTEGSITIDETITIDGATGSDVVISGDALGNDVLVGISFITDIGASTPSLALDDNSQIFEFAVDDADGSILNNLTLTGGRSTVASDDGGAIRSFSDLTITDSIIAGNGVINGSGGGIAVSSASLSITGSTVTQNLGILGGGLFFGGSGSRDLEITNSTFSYNSGTFGGGTALFLDDDGNTISNSTFFGNTALQAGGAIFAFANIGDDGVLTVTQTTITGNNADIGGGVVSGEQVSNETILAGNIIAGNSATIAGNDIASSNDGIGDNTFVSLGGNVIGNGEVDGMTTFFSPMNSDGDVVGTTANPIDLTTVFSQIQALNGTITGVLADNGGLVETIALVSNALNPALDTNSFGGALDSRGEQRSVDLAGVTNGGPADSGSFELQFAEAAPPSFFVTTNLDVVSDVDGLTSLREAIAFANADPDVSTITFDDSVFTGGADSLIRLTEGALVINQAVNIIGSTGTDIIITGDANNNDVTFAGTDITDISNSSEAQLSDNSRVFNITSETATTELDALTITGGRTVNLNGDGGGIFSAAGVTLTNSTVRGNSTLANNGDGGGIGALNDVTLINSTVNDNATFGAAAAGGGISAFNGNSSTLTLTNSTIANNYTASSLANGGGAQAISIVAVNSTITGNSTTAVNSYGGGLFAYAGIELTNTIVLGNDAIGVSSTDDLDEVGFIAGAATPRTFNGLNIVGSSSASFDASTDAAVINADATLVFAQTTSNGDETAGVLADNGGPVQTIALAGNVLNPAIDSATSALATDARGIARSIDQTGIDNGGTADLGAFEFQTLEITGSEVAESITGTDLNDTILGLGGPDTIDGGAGFDTASFADSTALVIVNLITGRGVAGSANRDVLINIEGLIGSNQDDVLIAQDTAVRNELNGLAGDDTIFGFGGDDVIFGDAGEDLLLAGDGNDTVIAGLDDDIIEGGNGDDTLFGGGGDDLIFGADGDDMIFGDEGDDILLGGADADVINGGLDDDLLVGGAGNNTLIGGEGNNLILGGNDVDVVTAGSGNDVVETNGGDDIVTLSGGDNVVLAGEGADTITSGDGIDALIGGGGNDSIDGGGGADTLIGGLGNDTLDGGGGGDVIIASAGANLLNGGAGNDFLEGGELGDTLNGGSGTDFIIGGLGDDTIDGGAGFGDQLIGGAGADTFVFTADDEGSVIVDFGNDVDVLDVSAFGFDNVSDVLATGTQVGANAFFDFGGVTTLIENTQVADLADDILI